MRGTAKVSRSHSPDLCHASQQGQITGADGAYQFLLLPGAPAGTYNLTVTPPAGYSLSTLLPAQTGALNAATCPVDPAPADPCLVVRNDNAPTGTDPTRYFLSLIIGAGAQNVVNNHIALDPAGGFSVIELRKSAAKTNVIRGELVPYTITARNTRIATVSNVALVDTIPPGFKYVQGSARLDRANGASVQLDPIVNGRVLTFGSQNFGPTETLTLKMLLVVGAGVGEGDYTNQVVGRLGDANGRAMSNQASAVVRIVEDPLFDCTDVIGKVYDDRNANGYQDNEEPGLPGVRVATVRGELLTTDAQGRFHVQCGAVPDGDIGSNYVLKVDARTLPSGYRVTTDNPLTERLTRGRVVKMSFGATIHRVVRLDLSDAAFDGSGDALQPAYAGRLSEVIGQLRAAPSILRLAYQPGSVIEASRADARMQWVREAVLDAWSRERRRDASGNETPQYNLVVEIEIVEPQAGQRAQP